MPMHKMLAMRKGIKDFYGRVLGYVDYDYRGDGTATNFYGQVLGKYRSSDDRTVDFYGKVLYQGDCLSALVVLASKGIKP